jgi:hypothetical protein
MIISEVLEACKISEFGVQLPVKRHYDYWSCSDLGRAGYCLT